MIRRRSILLSIALAIACFTSKVQKPIAEVPVRIHSGIVFAPVLVNGRGPFWFEIDSGFQNCAIEETLASSLGLQVDPRQTIDAPGGQIERATVRDAGLQIGGRELSGAAVSALDLAQFGPFFGRAPEGILGDDFFRAFVVEIDYEKAVVRLFDKASFLAPAGAVVVPIDTTSKQPYVTARVMAGGAREGSGRFLIDTGSMDALSLNTPFAEAHSFARPPDTILSVRGRSIGGETDGVLTRVAALEVAGISIVQPVAGVVQDQVERAGQISAETLRRFSLTFDYSRDRLYLVPNGAFREPFEIDMAGWFIIAAGPQLEQRRIFLVLDGSPAAEAGVKEGDELVTVNGREAASFTLDQLRTLFKRPEQTWNVRLRRDGKPIDVVIRTKKLI